MCRPTATPGSAGALALSAPNLVNISLGGEGQEDRTGFVGARDARGREEVPQGGNMNRTFCFLDSTFDRQIVLFAKSPVAFSPCMPS